MTKEMIIVLIVIYGSIAGFVLFTVVMCIHDSHIKTDAFNKAFLGIPQPKRNIFTGRIIKGDK